MLTGVASKYGKDSAEYEKAGGTKKSDIKRGPKKMVASRGARDREASRELLCALRHSTFNHTRHCLGVCKCSMCNAPLELYSESRHKDALASWLTSSPT